MSRHLAEATKQEIALRRRAHIHEPQRVGHQFVDAMAWFFGSPLFGVLFTVLTAVWLRWLEEPPYGTFTMVLSLLAIYMAWVLLMNQNRQAAKDRQRDDLEAAEVDEMVKLNQQQVEHDQWTRRDMERQDHDLVAIGRALKAELGRR